MLYQLSFWANIFKNRKKIITHFSCAKTEDAKITTAAKHAHAQNFHLNPSCKICLKKDRKLAEMIFFNFIFFALLLNGIAPLLKGRMVASATFDAFTLNHCCYYLAIYFYLVRVKTFLLPLKGQRNKIFLKKQMSL